MTVTVVTTARRARKLTCASPIRPVRMPARASAPATAPSGARVRQSTQVSPHALTDFMFFGGVILFVVFCMSTRVSHRSVQTPLFFCVFWGGGNPRALYSSEVIPLSFLLLLFVGDFPRVRQNYRLIQLHFPKMSSIHNGGMCVE